MTANEKRKSLILENLTSHQTLGGIDQELLSKLKLITEERDKLKKELSSLQTSKEENAKLKSLVVSQGKEIEILEEKLDLYDTAKQKNEEELEQEIRQEIENQFKAKIDELSSENQSLKNQLSEKNSRISSLELNLSDNKVTIENAHNLNKNLQDQITKRSTNDLTQINSLMSEVSKLKIEKEMDKKKIKELNDQLHNFSTNYSSISSSSLEMSGVNEYKKALTHLKLDLKSQAKKFEEEKLQMDKALKDKEVELCQVQIKNEELEETIILLNTENEELRKTLEELKLSSKKASHAKEAKVDLTEINKLKEQIEKLKKDNEEKVKELTLSLSQKEEEITKYKSTEKVYKEQVEQKNKDTESKTSFINEIQTCLNKQIDENLKIKQENIQLKNEKTLLTTQNEELNSKVEKVNNELKETKNLLDQTQKESIEKIKKKKKIISNKKKENLILAEMVNSKKNEIQCVEALQLIESESIKGSLAKIREKEQEYLKSIEELAKDPYYTDDSLEEESLDLDDSFSDGLLEEENN